MERPKEEVNLLSLSISDTPRRKTVDPTEDLITVKVGIKDKDEFAKILPKDLSETSLVWCDWTREIWCYPTKLCLNMNFIYRQDLKIKHIKSIDEAWEFYKETAIGVNPGIIATKVYYLLDNPANESYELYYDSNYTSLKFGKATTNEMFVHKYSNRLHRDMAVLELDDIYSNQSSKKAGKIVARAYKPEEAIIVTDDAWMKEVCTSSFIYKRFL